MTREDRELSITYLEGIKEKYIEGEGYERHPLPEYYAIETAIKVLGQEPCEDAISRETVVKYIKEKCNPYGKPSIDFEAGKKAIEYFKALPPVTPTQRWIPVSERLPEESGLYLVTIRLTFSKDDKYVSVKDSDDWELLEKCGHEVIAWMLLPEPYVESEA